MRIAVIGAGVSGLTAAWTLAARHDILLFEREARLGGHAHTHDVAASGRVVPVDTGFMVFNERTYPNFVRMLDTLGVESRPSDMSFSVRCDRCDIEYSSVGLRGLFAQPRRAFTAPHLAMLADVLRFFRAGRAALADDSARGQSLGAFLDAHRFGDELIRHFVLPMGGAIWSASSRTMRDFPAASYLRFLENHGLLAASGQPVWRTIVGGSRSYVQRIAAAIGAGVRVGHPVTRITRTASGAVVQARGLDAVTVDAVVIATHADEALALLGDASAEERDALGAFRYSVNPTVLHGDARWLPATPAARASWNVRMPDCRDEQRPVTVTYDLARLQGLDGAGPMLCTLNGDEIGAPVHARMTYAHPILDRAAIDAQPRVAALNGTRQTYFCGAHLRYGFHEDGVMSALAAVARLEASA
ncbi:MAG: FAD-dependent oxidoreductase [Vicinamibacterales bacterium]